MNLSEWVQKAPYTANTLPLRTLGWHEFRNSVKTTDWNEAEHRIRSWENNKGLDQQDDQPDQTVHDLAEKYVSDMQAEGWFRPARRNTKCCSDNWKPS